MKRRTLCLGLVVLLAVVCGAKSWGQDLTENSRRLLDAAENGHMGEVQSLLESGVLPDVKDEFGRTPLHLAAGHGHRQTAQALLDNGAPLNAKDNEGRSALDYAKANGHSGMAQYLRDKGAQVAPPSSGPPAPELRAFNPTLKYKTLEAFEKAIGEPAVFLDDANVCFFVPKRREKEARIVFKYLVKAYDELYAIVGTHTEYKIAVYAFPKGNAEGWGGTSNCSIEYDDSNLALEKSREWTQHGVPHVSGYIEEMAHNFVHATKAQFGWEMVGWSIGVKATQKVANNPIFREQIRATREGQQRTFARYVQDGFVFPADIPANQCDRIHAWILWQCEKNYGPTFWRDAFREIRKEAKALKDAVHESGGDRIRNARYKITVDCFNRMSKKLAFKERLKKARISATVDVKSLHPEKPGWNRRLTE